MIEKDNSTKLTWLTWHNILGYLLMKTGSQHDGLIELQQLVEMCSIIDHLRTPYPYTHVNMHSYLYCFVIS